MFGSFVRSRRGTASATYRIGHVDAVEQEEQFNRRLFTSGISTSDYHVEKEGKKGKEKEATAVEISVSFSFPRFAFSGGKKKRKKRSFIQ